ncbi:glycine cleavage system protein R [Aliikangiella marina]|uniref:Glycine cleavage system transcriptional repressor n=1 Tax=Aliikangiella marina TaxID=1712262 RepID=A0A545TJV5_9GAMM|nr:ACT domain-containing protein [Aliikangiella marina]TQV77487.1 glycine cleavage system protein R [Aliikangiella marina]
MQNHLVISAIAPNRPGIANEITSLVTKCGCNILESKMKSMGDTFSLILMAAGEWNSIAKLEHTLPSKASSMQMTTMMQRTEIQQPKPELPYRVKIFSLDNPGITQEITHFFTDNGINIQEMSCNTYPAQHTGAMVGATKLTVSIPTSLQVSKIREKFRLFCDKTNLDGEMKPIGQD